MALQALGGGIEPVRARPGMFIGDTQTPNHLAEELLDNAIDEIANGFATVINIFSNSEDNSFWVSDNGRGIPMEPMKLPNGIIEDSIKVLCTELFSGTKFDTEDYAQLIGMHGVGLVAVNALSDWLIVKTRDRKNRKRVVTYSFIDGILQDTSEEIDDDFSYSTIVGFKPSKKYFNSLEFDNRYFVERLIAVQSIFGLDGFTFNNKPIPKLDFESYVKRNLALAESEELHVLSFSTNDNSNHIRIYATYVNQDDSIILGNVNLRACDGKFISSFSTELKKSISKKIDKRFSGINDKDYLNGLRAFIIMSIPEPKFDSQTKVRMVLDVKKLLIDPLKDQIDWFVDQIIDTLQANLERKLHQKFVKSSSKSARSNKRVSVSKLRDCQYIPGDILYIVEGDSADGTLKQIRDKKTEACFPLKGKVLNVETSTFDKIQKNKEISDLLKALGPINSRRYRSIKILADSDSVGAETPIVYIDNNNLLRWNYIKDIDDIQYVQSMDSNGNIEWKKVIRVIKHKYNKNTIYRIKSKYGHFIDCTDDHVVYVYNILTSNIEQKTPTNINVETDYLICPKAFPSQTDIEYEINITQELMKLDKRNTIHIITSFENYENDLDDNLVRVDIGNRVKYTKSIKRKRLSTLININSSSLQQYDTGRDSTKAPLSVVKNIVNYIDIDLENAETKIALTSSSLKYLSRGELYHRHKKIRNKFKLTEQLAYLIGFYLGDGCHGSSKNNPFEIIFLYGIDETCKQNLINCCEALEFNSFIIDQTTQTSHIFRLKSIEFSAILEHFGLTQNIKAYDKFVPQIFFSCNEKIRIALLMGLLHSDGSLFKQNAGFRLNHTSTSKKLQIDIDILFRQFGIIPVLQQQEPKQAGLNQYGQQITEKRKTYSTTINRNEDLKKLKDLCESFNTIDFSEIEKSNGKILVEKTKTSYIIPIRDIEEIAYSDEYVYDLEVEDNNNFAAGTLGAIYHNSDGQHISILVLLAIAKFAPDYIKSGNLAIIIPPLYGAEKGGKYYPIYDRTQIEQFRRNNFKIHRFKGLGEMNPYQLEACIRSGFEYKVKWPDTDEQLNNLISIITNTDLKRALLNVESVRMDVILAEVEKQRKKTN